MNKLTERRDVNRLIFLCTATYFISYITRINYGAIIAEIAKQTGITNTLLSLALSGQFITYGCGQIISGYFGDRIQPKKLIASGLLVASLMNLLLPFCANAMQMAVVWSINGFAQAFLWPPLMKEMTSLLFAEVGQLPRYNFCISYISYRYFASKLEICFFHSGCLRNRNDILLKPKFL